jgi:hypothetical protein
MKVRRPNRMVNGLSNKAKTTAAITGTATESRLKPGDYPVGSLESRAAARALVQDRDKGGKEIQIIFVSPDGMEVNGPKLKVGG